MNYKYGALIILYHPTQDEIDNIIYISQYYDETYVFDNTEGKSNDITDAITAENASEAVNDVVESQFNFNYIDSLKGLGIQTFGNGENMGLSIAYNMILEKALADNVDWLSIYDQDSKINAETIERLKKYVEGNDTSNTASLVPVIQYGTEIPETNNTIDVKWAINSGQMLNVKCLHKYNIRYDENLFLDRVDRDFCKQLEVKGLRIVQVKGAVLKQKLGEEYKGHSTHSPIRTYYMCKNRLYYNHKYNDRGKAFLLNLAQTFKHIFLIIRFGKDKGKHFYMIRKAIEDYQNSQMGEYRQ